MVKFQNIALEFSLGFPDPESVLFVIVLVLKEMN